MSLNTFKTIGDQLTTNEFNAIISLYRQFIKHYDDLKINEEVQGKYGKYLFDVDGCDIVDNGIAITNNTITAQPKVKLTNNVFNDSTYTLELTILDITGANILDDTIGDYTSREIVEVTLTPDTWTNIPLTDIEGVILYDCRVQINHDKVVTV